MRTSALMAFVLLIGCSGGQRASDEPCKENEWVFERADNKADVATLPDLNHDGKEDFAVPRGCEVLCRQELYLSEGDCFRFAGQVNGHLVTVEGKETKGHRNLVVVQTAPIAGAVVSYQWNGVAYEETGFARAGLAYP